MPWLNIQCTVIETLPGDIFNLRSVILVTDGNSNSEGIDALTKMIQIKQMRVFGMLYSKSDAVDFPELKKLSAFGKQYLVSDGEEESDVMVRSTAEDVLLDVIATVERVPRQKVYLSVST